MVQCKGGEDSEITSAAEVEITRNERVRCLSVVAVWVVWCCVVVCLTMKRGECSCHTDVAHFIFQPFEPAAVRSIVGTSRHLSTYRWRLH